MTKLINSEQKYLNPNFKVKIGTTNKKKAETVYLQLGTYIEPKEEMQSFSNYITSFDKEIRYHVNKLINKNKDCANNFILITDIADERICKNKKSYLDLQIFIKPNNETKDKFKTLANNIYNNYAIDIMTYIENEFKRNNIECHKTKK